MRQRIFIVAGTHQQAESYAHDWELEENRWTYVGEGQIEKLYGTTNPDVRYVGTYMARTDLLDIQHEVEARKVKS